MGVLNASTSGLLRSSNREPPRSLGTPTPPYDPASNPWHMPFDPSWTYGKPAGADAVKPKKRPVASLVWIAEKSIPNRLDMM